MHPQRNLTPLISDENFFYIKKHQSSDKILSPKSLENSFQGKTFLSHRNRPSLPQNFKKTPSRNSFTNFFVNIFTSQKKNKNLLKEENSNIEISIYKFLPLDMQNFLENQYHSLSQENLLENFFITISHLLKEDIYNTEYTKEGMAGHQIQKQLRTVRKSIRHWCKNFVLSTWSCWQLLERMHSVLAYCFLRSLYGSNEASV